MYKFVQVF